MDPDVAQELEWSKAQEIVFSVNLVNAAKRQLKFLAAIDNIHCLHDGPALDREWGFRFSTRPTVRRFTEDFLATETSCLPLKELAWCKPSGSGARRILRSRTILIKVITPPFAVAWCLKRI